MGWMNICVSKKIVLTGIVPFHNPLILSFLITSDTIPIITGLPSVTLKQKRFM